MTCTVPDIWDAKAREWIEQWLAIDGGFTLDGEGAGITLRMINIPDPEWALDGRLPRLLREMMTHDGLWGATTRIVKNEGLLR